MADIMTFPNTVDEFMEQYKVIDTDHVYTNGTELVPIFRMKQWFEHVKTADVPHWIPCCERLPEKPVGFCYFNHDGEDVPGKEYIVMIEDAIEPTSLYWTGDVWFSPYGIDEDTEYDVIAWMPLPAPYKRKVKK